MRKKAAYFACLVIVAVSIFGGENWNGMRDTSRISKLYLDTIRYSKPFTLGEWEAIEAVLKINDTASAGFASDSIAIVWGYQTFCLVKDTAGNADTAFMPRVVLDTCRKDSFGLMTVGKINAAGTPTEVLQSNVDTLKVTGYAVQTVYFVPRWNVWIRYWAQGITGNKAGANGLRAIIQHTRRLYQRAD